MTRVTDVTVLNNYKLMKFYFCIYTLKIEAYSSLFRSEKMYFSGDKDVQKLVFRIRVRIFLSTVSTVVCIRIYIFYLSTRFVRTLYMTDRDV